MWLSNNLLVRQKVCLFIWTLISYYTMTNNSQKQRIFITVDSQLLEEIDQMTKNRSDAVEEGLRLWRKQQIEEQLRKFFSCTYRFGKRNFAIATM